MNVIKIAICDDEEKAVALHERIVKACLQSQGIGYEITTYTQSRNLLYDITDDGFFYDLILLDIEMPGISGMEIPQQLKGFLPNVRIIFVTSHTEYAIDAFELSIFRYVPKNNLEVKLAILRPGFGTGDPYAARTGGAILPEVLSVYLCSQRHCRQYLPLQLADRKRRF